MDPRIEKLFADYGKSFSALEMRRIAGLYAEQFVAAGPKGVISQGREAFLENRTGRRSSTAASGRNRRSCCRRRRRGSASST